MFSADSLRALPRSFIIIPILVFLAGKKIIFPELAWLVAMPVHEVGHALTSWLCGWPAIPIYFMSVPLTEAPGLVWSLLLAVIFAVGLISAHKRNFNWMVGVIAFLTPLLFLCSFCLTRSQQEAAILLGGLGGEIVLGALCMSAGLCRFPETPRWQGARLVLTCFGAISFGGALSLWLSAGSNPTLLPMGALLDFGMLSGSESSGDLDRLIREFGWNTETIIQAGYWSSIICSGVFCVFYLGMALWTAAANEAEEGESH